MLLIQDKGAEFALVAGPVTNVDMGPSYVKDGITYIKVSNGNSFRYRPVSGSQIPIIPVNTTIDENSASKTFFRFVIPGGVLVSPEDVITVTYTLTGTLLSNVSGHFATFVSSPEYSSVNRPLSNRGNSSGTRTMSFRIKGIESVLLSPENISNWSNENSGGPMICNVLNDITVNIYGTIGAGSGYTHSIGPVTVTYTNTTSVNPVSDTTNYRLPQDQWFSNDSPWNLPLPPQTIRGDLTHILAQDIRDRWFGRQTKSGGGQTTVMWASVQASSSTGPAHIPIYQASESDPVLDLYVRGVSSNIKPHGAYFVPGARTSAYSYKMRMPAAMLPGQVGDHACLVITPDKRYAIEMGSYDWNATLNRHECNRLSIVDLYGKGFSALFWPFNGTTRMATGLTTENYGYNFNYRAGGNTFIGGIVTKKELDLAVATNSEIPHMICMQTATYVLRTARFRLVSTTSNTITVDSISNNLNFINYTLAFSTPGTRIRITTNPNVTGLPVYTTTGETTYDSSTGFTTFTVNETISAYTGAEVQIGGTTKEWFDYSYVWPMTARDSAANIGQAEYDGYNGNIPMGQVYTYPESFNVEALAVSAEAKAIARSIKKYGLMVVDAAGNTNNLCQCDQYWTATNRSNVIANAFAVIQNLVPVLNYNQTLHAQAVADTTIAKPKPILPLYTNTP